MLTGRLTRAPGQTMDLATPLSGDCIVVPADEISAGQHGGIECRLRAMKSSDPINSPSNTLTPAKATDFLCTTQWHQSLAIRVVPLLTTRSALGLAHIVCCSVRYSACEAFANPGCSIRSRRFRFYSSLRRCLPIHSTDCLASMHRSPQNCIFLAAKQKSLDVSVVTSEIGE